MFYPIFLGIRFIPKEPFTILRTKLHRPQVTNDITSREDLLDRLDEGRSKPLGGGWVPEPIFFASSRL
jgi:hypothetical protein